MTLTMYALVDCNNFYVSCERVFAPQWQGRPVVVLSNNDGCLISRSDEAKVLGFKMGEPYHQVRPLLELSQVKVFSSNYALYGDMSRRVVQVLSEFAAGVEVYSIDEAFLDFRGMNWLAPDLQRYGEQLRERVWRATGIPTCVGIAPTKTLAKLANRLARKQLNPVKMLNSKAECQAALAQTLVGDVWGIGRRYARKLREQGIMTAADLAAQPESWVRRYLGGVVGGRLWRELHGQPCLEWNPSEHEDDDEHLTPGIGRHSVTHTRSFGCPQQELAALSEAVATFAARTAEKLRRHGLAAHLVTVLLGTDRYAPGIEPATRTAVVHLPIATHDTPLLTQAALRGLRQLHRPGVAYHRAGVLLSGLETAGQGQLDLFTSLAPLPPARLQLMTVLDRLNNQFGRHTVRLAAAAGPNPGWAGRRAYQSPAYTTDWENLWQLK
ncbi:Y-family DNA polymerase [Hymenobacter sp. ASUV-10]|uniref:Y-family DNA polymerase n=1 Tax=Hymenobacter aranciens TaxID=3063996 RepID=A0ABT9BHL9_9BACT|nr:Y-family DNA polymerase [Hymenobacter sp. ASUV-10]MDO7877759.1 Y-family DNA polymerase [Hymenobacter sp. ASUV-10]